ncbi:SDR family oxidoreductase [Psychroflexus aestuariivivens]|uniref:SDR family oxidoreductase n=1 Tax=Psychroflexus aestuariivivens TaxID=1795040 RepID=UPI000FD9B541|nr:SDR family oxidoreductase [Psychroflexus aestuariivivens]
MLEGKTYLITGIADENSLAMYVAKKIKENGGQVVCTGLGVSKHHSKLSDKAKAFLNKTYDDFQKSVHSVLGKKTHTEILDVTLPESIEAFCEKLISKNIQLDGFLHAIAMDKTIRNKVVKPLLDVSFQEFCDTMEVSAYSLISLTSHLFKNNLLNADSSICSLSYIAASKVTFHPYRNISIAKAALERITVELADELGRKNGTRVNCLRFSPYMGSKAGNATLNEQDVQFAHRKSPLGNALPEDLAYEVLNLLRPNGRTTGEIRHVDGGYNIMG